MAEDTNIVALADRREPVHIQVGIVHRWDGQVETYIGGTDLSIQRNREIIAETLEGLVVRLRSPDNDFTPAGPDEVPA